MRRTDLPPVTAMVGALLLFLAPLAAVSGADRAAPEVAVLAAAIAYAAEENRCSQETPCCFGVDGKPPSRALVERLGDKPGLSPVQEAEAQKGVDACWSLHAKLVQRPPPEREGVTIWLGPWQLEPPLTICTYFLRRAKGRWEVVPSETGCPIL